MWPPRHDGAVLADTSATDARMWPPRHDGAVLADTSATDARMWPPRHDGAVLADTPGSSPGVPCIKIIADPYHLSNSRKLRK